MIESIKDVLVLWFNDKPGNGDKYMDMIRTIIDEEEGKC